MTAPVPWHVRLKGVTAPEVEHPRDSGEPGGEAAKAFMMVLIEGRPAVCDLTQERTHGRRSATATVTARTWLRR
jgi:endonuclease YncB( thermonuclease family)